MSQSALSSSHLYKAFDAAQIVPELIGRTPILEKIQRIVQEDFTIPTLIFITGDGGIGKTRLLKEILETLRDIPGYTVASDLVDLYHVSNHTAGGLAHSMKKTLPHEAFPRYEAERQKLTRYRTAGMVGGVAEQRELTLKAFDQDRATLAKTQHVVHALDTAERLIYGGASFPQTITSVSEVWTWLIQENLPRWEGDMLIMAGRPEARSLLETMQNHPSYDKIRVIPIELEPFTKEESEAYFEAVIRDAERKNPLVAERVRDSLAPEDREHIHALAEGHPIRLSMIVDYIAVAPNLGQVRDLLQSIATGEATSTSLRLSLEHLLMWRFNTLTPIGETIRALGRAQKGADLALLQRLLDLSPEEAEERLHHLRELSFVKIRQEDDRIFLHDVLYELLHRQVYSLVTEVSANEEADQIIDQFYEDELALRAGELEELYRSSQSRHQGPVNFEQLGKIHAHRRYLLGEQLFYLLRRNTNNGLLAYHRYVLDAVNSRDTGLALQLHAELLIFLAEQEKDPERYPLSEPDRKQIFNLMVTRDIVRLWSENRYDDSLKAAATLRTQARDALSDLLTDAHLSIGEAHSLAYKGGSQERQLALSKLHGALLTLWRYREAHPIAADTIPPFHLWVTLNLMASAYRLQGYIHRLEGAMREAVANYEQAVELWRFLDVEGELAGMLNDIAFALSVLGELTLARSLIEEALLLRRKLGRYYALALSLNTSALIHLREGKYDKAIAEVDQAMAYFSSFDDLRGQALAQIALAEALRRESHDANRDPLDHLHALREASDQAKQALETFKKTNEVTRLVDAYIELGCTYRDWIQVRAQLVAPRDSLLWLTTQGELALREAAWLAEDTILYRKLDAAVNLALLGLYADRGDIVSEAITMADASIPDSYRLNPNTGQPAIDPRQAQTMLWYHIAKLYSLRGYTHLAPILKGNLVEEDIEPALRQSIEDYTLALAYLTLYSADINSLPYTRQQIREPLTRLDPAWLPTVSHAVNEVEERWHLASPSRFRTFLQEHNLWQA